MSVLPPHTNGNDERLNRAVPSAAFEAELRSKLLVAHATHIHPRFARMRWFTIPVVLAAAIAVIVLLPKGTLSADQFLERAAAAMNSFAEGETGINYTKKRMEFPAHTYGTGAEIYTNVGPGVPAGNPPYIQELWSGIVGNGWVMMDRRSDEVGKRLSQRLDFYPAGNEEMLYAETSYVWWPDPKNTPVCVSLELSDAERGAFREKYGDEVFTQSGSHITTYIREEDVDATGQFYGSDGAKSVQALRSLLKKGSVRELPVTEEKRATERTFRMDSISAFLGADGKPSGTPEVSGYTLYTFSATDYRLVREEIYSIFDGKDLLEQRTDYLTNEKLPQSAAKDLFDPVKQDLFDPWTTIGITRKQVEQIRSEYRCFYRGKWLGNDPFAIFNLPPDVQARMQVLMPTRLFVDKPAPRGISH